MPIKLCNQKLLFKANTSFALIFVTDNQFHNPDGIDLVSSDCGWKAGRFSLPSGN